MLESLSQLTMMCTSPSVDMKDIFGKPFWGDEHSLATASTAPDTVVSTSYRSSCSEEGGSPVSQRQKMRINSSRSSYNVDDSNNDDEPPVTSCMPANFLSDWTYTLQVQTSQQQRQHQQQQQQQQQQEALQNREQQRHKDTYSEQYRHQQQLHPDLKHRLHGKELHKEPLLDLEHSNIPHESSGYDEEKCDEKAPLPPLLSTAAPLQNLPPTAVDLDLPPTAVDLDEVSGLLTNNDDLEGSIQTKVKGSLLHPKPSMVARQSTTSTAASSPTVVAGNLPVTAIDLDDVVVDDDDAADDDAAAAADYDILSYNSSELEACWDDIDQDELDAVDGLLKELSSVDSKMYTTTATTTTTTSRRRSSHYRSQRYPSRIVTKSSKTYDATADEPPLSAQTPYARQQFLRSSRYRSMRKVQPQPQYQQSCGYDDTDEFECYLDEVDISRGLMGYEEGFDVPKIHSALPFVYEEQEKEEEEEDDQEELGKVEEEDDGTEMGNGSDSQYFLEKHRNRNSSLSVQHQQLSKRESNIRTKQSSSSSSNSVCFHCSQGTCDNKDCSASRFMI